MLLAASVLAAVLIALVCGRCESSMKVHCMNTITAIASSLSLTGTKSTALPANSPTDTTSRMTGRSTNPTSATSSKDSANTKNFATSEFDFSNAVNMAKKHNAPIITSSSSIVPSMTYRCIDLTKAFTPTKVQRSPNSGRTASQRSANATTTPPLTPLATSSKKSTDIKQRIITCEWTNTDAATGSNPNT